MIILLAGYAGSGKDTVANILVKEHGFHKYALADKLKKLIYDLDVAFECGHNCVSSGLPRTIMTSAYVQAVVDIYGWEKGKREYPELRQLLQKAGDVAKQTFGQHVWVEAVLDEIIKNHEETSTGFDADIVISDVRYQHEVEQFSHYFTPEELKVVWIDRLYTKPANDHQSEHDMKDYEHFAFSINNCLDIVMLEMQTEWMLQEVKYKKKDPAVLAEPFGLDCIDYYPI